jgi:hypothetical protein
MKKNFYVYVYLDQRRKGNYIYGIYKFSYEPFYIGKGKNSRLKDHLFENDLYNTEKHKRILQIKSECSKNPIIIKYAKNLSEEQAFDLEIDMITTIGRNLLQEGPLLNIQKGGQGFSGWIPTQNWIQKIKKAAKVRWNNPENRRKQSVVLKNIGQTKSFKEKSSKTTSKRWKNNREIMISYQHRDNVKKKKSETSIKANSKIWILISPSGKRFITDRLKIFCELYNLKTEPLQRVAMAKQLHYKNWLCFKDGEENIIREKLQIASTGRRKSEEEKRKIGEAAKGNKHSLGYKHSKNTKEKIRKSSIDMWKRRKLDKRRII